MRLPTKANNESHFDMKTKNHDPKAALNNVGNLLELTCTTRRRNAVDNKCINKLKFPLPSGLGVTKGAGRRQDVHSMLEDALRITSDASVGDLDSQQEIANPDINDGRLNRLVNTTPSSNCQSLRPEYQDKKTTSTSEPLPSDNLIRIAPEELDLQQENADHDINPGRLNRFANIAPLSKCQTRQVEYQDKKQENTARDINHGRLNRFVNIAPLSKCQTRQAKKTTSASQELFPDRLVRIVSEDLYPQQENSVVGINRDRLKRFVNDAPFSKCQTQRVDYQAKKTPPTSQEKVHQIRTKQKNVLLMCIKNISITQLIDVETKPGSMMRATLIWLTFLGVASIAFGSFNNFKESTFDVLRDMNNLTGLQTFVTIFGQQLCALFTFTALEIREDMILPPEENRRRGIGTEWPRSRVYNAIYIEFPIYWALCFVLFCCARAPIRIFSKYEQETWAVWAVKMIVWFIVWEFLMYCAHRAFHSSPWLYKIAHKGHHVVMDFALGPHAPPLEKLTHYVASIIASQIVGISFGSWILALNILMIQCVLEHSYSSLTIPLWNGILEFNTADIHQLHHVNNNGNFGYAFNIFDPIFGTLLEKTLSRSPPQVTGPATSARLRMLMRGCSKRNLFERSVRTK